MKNVFHHKSVDSLHPASPEFSSPKCLLTNKADRPAQSRKLQTGGHGDDTSSSRSLQNGFYAFKETAELQQVLEKKPCLLMLHKRPHSFQATCALQVPQRDFSMRGSFSFKFPLFTLKPKDEYEAAARVAIALKSCLKTFL